MKEMIIELIAFHEKHLPQSATYMLHGFTPKELTDLFLEMKSYLARLTVQTGQNTMVLDYKLVGKCSSITLFAKIEGGEKSDE